MKISHKLSLKDSIAGGNKHHLSIGNSYLSIKSRTYTYSRVFRRNPIQHLCWIYKKSKIYSNMLEYNNQTLYVAEAIKMTPRSKHIAVNIIFNDYIRK